MTNEVILTPDIKRRLLVAAHARNDGKAASQSRKKSKKFNDLEMDYLGVKGEFVISTLFGVPFDEKSYGQGGDTGIDLVIDGFRCGVKTNHRLNGYLLVEFLDELEKVDHLLLVSGHCDAKASTCLCRNIEAAAVLNLSETWLYKGWVTVALFKEQMTAKTWDYGERFYVKQSQLIQPYFPLAAVSAA